MNNMILGTVQLGLNYGVNNTEGKPTKEQAWQILDYAFQCGVTMLDTASAYGESEQVIGEYIKKTGCNFSICTKLPLQISSSEILGTCETALERLCVDSFFVYYLHRYDQCQDSGIIKALKQLREQGYVKKIGVSIYEPEELRYIIQNLFDIVDVVQLPYNLLDCARWKQEGLLKEAVDAGVQIYARSIYLQGLLLADVHSQLVTDMQAKRQLHELQRIADNRHMSMAELAVAFVDSSKEISKYMIGCETLAQLKENIRISKQGCQLGDDEMQQIEHISAYCDEQLIDPRRWRR